MKVLLTAGLTSFRDVIFIQDTGQSDGRGLTGLTNASAGLTWYYWREDSGNTGGVAVSVVSATRGSWTSGGFVEIDATNLPGFYEIGYPNAVLAAGAKWAVMEMKGAVNMTAIPIQIELSVFDLQVTPGAILESGTLQTATSTTAQLRAGASAVDNDPTLVGMILYIESGTGAGQGSRIASYVGTTKIATVDGWRSTTPDSTSKYIVL